MTESQSPHHIGDIETHTDSYFPKYSVWWSEWDIAVICDYGEAAIDIHLNPEDARKLAAFIVEAAEKAEMETERVEKETGHAKD